MPPMALIVACCTHEAAKHACARWHYSTQPSRGRYAAHGVWETPTADTTGRKVFRGALMYGHGSVPGGVGQPYGLDQHQAAELTRIALGGHTAPVSQILARSVRLLRHHNPGLRLLVSYADPAEGHHGGIYIAQGWTYTGTATSQGGVEPAHIVHGRHLHPRAVRKRGWKNTTAWLRENVDPKAEPVPHQPKHRYLLALDKTMREQILTLAKAPPTATPAAFDPCECGPALDTPGEEPCSPPEATAAAPAETPELELTLFDA